MIWSFTDRSLDPTLNLLYFWGYDIGNMSFSKFSRSFGHSQYGTVMFFVLKSFIYILNKQYIQIIRVQRSKGVGCDLSCPTPGPSTTQL